MFMNVNIIIEWLYVVENIVELLTLLLEPNSLRNFGWPECSVDAVLQTVLVKCGKEPCSNMGTTELAHRLRANTQMLFSFIVDDPVALENLFSRRSIDQVLEQVIYLAKSGDSPTELVQLNIWVYILNLQPPPYSTTNQRSYNQL